VRRARGHWVLLAALLVAGTASAQVGFGFLAETPLARFNADDLKMMNAAIEKALGAPEPGTPVHWANDQTASSGEVIPQRAFEHQGRPCRDLRVVNRHRRLESSGIYTMCRDNDRWSLTP